MFIKNYLYELPEDIQIIIYKNVFARCITDIDKDKSIKYLVRLYTATNNPNTISKAWYRYIYYDESAMGRNNFLKSRGYSIRCLKN